MNVPYNLQINEYISLYGITIQTFPVSVVRSRGVSPLPLWALNYSHCEERTNGIVRFNEYFHIHEMYILIFSKVFWETSRFPAPLPSIARYVFIMINIHISLLPSREMETFQTDCRKNSCLEIIIFLLKNPQRGSLLE